MSRPSPLKKYAKQARPKHTRSIMLVELNKSSQGTFCYMG